MVLRKKYLLILCGILFSSILYTQNNKIPPEFAYIDEHVDLIILDIRYAGKHNFVGRPIKGYKQPQAIMSKKAIKQLKQASEYFLAKGYIIKVFDAYRPQRAVDQFFDWSKISEDTLMKSEFYPGLDKEKLFALGYIATKSGHSRGSTIDLTLVDLKTGKELDMGAPYDLFDEISHHNAKGLTKIQKKNRKMLKVGMRKFGFLSYAKEWWHYTLKNEPFPSTYFDFIVR
ncbi:M15 family metallopeptidase [uncultured Mesonia sp.]|uniref:M15 family metallopeptidase n=1 Tax=uncultured Mesonia sp. TaxID=399731 RepID=UPI00374EA774